MGVSCRFPTSQWQNLPESTAEFAGGSREPQISELQDPATRTSECGRSPVKTGASRFNQAVKSPLQARGICHHVISADHDRRW